MQDGGIADSRAKMEAILAANPDAGQHQRGLGGLGPAGARRAAGDRGGGPQGEGIVITGIDANPQARDAIAAGGNFEASIAQDFAGIGPATADAVATKLKGEEIQQSVIYVPTVLVTRDNAAQ